MGKPKRDRKNRQEEEFGDDDVDLDPLAKTDNTEMATAPSNKPSKKDKKKNRRKEEEEEDDVTAKMESLTMDSDEMNGEPDVPKPQKSKKDKKKNKKKDESDEDDADDDVPTVTQPSAASGTRKKKTMTTFDMLAALDDDNDMLQSDDESDSEINSENKKSEEEEVVLTPVETEASTSKKKEKKKKNKKATEEDEDIDAILAALEQPKEKSSKKSKKEKQQAETEAKSEVQMDAEGATEGENVLITEPKVVTMEDLDDDEEDTKKKRKKGKKKDKKETTEADEEDAGEEGGEEGESTVKTAAQKKKEKKEREKKKKEQQRLQGLKKKESTPVSDTPEGEKAGEEVPQTTEEGAAEVENEDEETEGKAKKKKKKGKEEKEVKKKGPSKQIAALKEHLKKVQEEEERLKLEEEEKLKKLEEARLQKEEQKRLEEERKQKKKQKEKERIEKLKAEGKFLTAKQKQDKKRAMQMLELMKAQGLDVPNKDEVPKKRPIYSKKKKSAQRQGSQEEAEKSPSPVEEVEMSKESSPETPTEETAPAVVQEVEAADEVKDSWDVSDDEVEEEQKETKVKPVTGQKKESVKVRSKSEEKNDDEESEEEGESEDEDEDESSEEESSDESSDEESEDDLTAVEKARIKIEKRREEAEKKRSTDKLRAPVVCVLGHVDTGKTKILDKLRRTNVQDGEAGGITQQIGATNVPRDAIRDKTTMCKEFHKSELKLPGLLIIDTPGHESFSNLRSRGSSLCDIAILVVDIMHGLEPQTIESINLLKSRKTPFIVALNKIDRLYQWKPNPNSDVVNTLKKQHPNTKIEFDERTREVIVQFAEQGLNAALFHENKNQREYVSLVPTSAHSGDGMGNLVALICELSQDLLAKRVSYSEELQATVMEVKAIHGLGTTIDVILVNGKIHEGQTIVTAGTEGPIVTQIRGLLMPQPMKELRVKNQYEKHKEVLAAQGVKLIAKDMDKALAGLPLYVAYDGDEVEFYKEEVSRAFKAVLSSIKLQERGVFVQASTLGSLEALLEFLRTSKIPYAGIGIGPVHKKDIMKASIMLEHDNQYAVILAFDVKVEREAQELADSMGVTIFSADIIYHLFDKFMAYRDELKKKKQEEFKHIAVFPTKLRILPQYIFNTRDPIVVGVIVEAGVVKEGTPLCVPSKEFVEIGRVTSIEFNHKQIDAARKGQEVCIKIEPLPSEAPKLYGRHFDATDLLVSKITRQSIDVVKEYFRDEMTKPDWQLIVELKKMFQII